MSKTQTISVLDQRQRGRRIQRRIQLWGQDTYDANLDVVLSAEPDTLTPDELMTAADHLADQRRWARLDAIAYRRRWQPVLAMTDAQWSDMAMARTGTYDRRYIALHLSRLDAIADQLDEQLEYVMRSLRLAVEAGAVLHSYAA